VITRSLLQVRSATSNVFSSLRRTALFTDFQAYLSPLSPRLVSLHYPTNPSSLPNGYFNRKPSVYHTTVISKGLPTFVKIRQILLPYPLLWRRWRCDGGMFSSGRGAPTKRTPPYSLQLHERNLPNTPVHARCRINTAGLVLRAPQPGLRLERLKALERKVATLTCLVYRGAGTCGDQRIPMRRVRRFCWWANCAAYVQAREMGIDAIWWHD
jgi:hypothetical protein